MGRKIDSKGGKRRQRKKVGEAEKRGEAKGEKKK